MTSRKKRETLRVLITREHHFGGINFASTPPDEILYYRYFCALMKQEKQQPEVYNNNSKFLKIRDITQIDIFMKRRFGKTKFNLPKIIHANLVRYFNEHLFEDDKFHCGFFVNFLYFGDLGPIRAKRWRFSELNSEKSLKTGDAVVICEVNDTSLSENHFAIYLGKGIYMSKYNSDKYLTFSTLPDMYMYGTFLRKMTPRRYK